MKDLKHVNFWIEMLKQSSESVGLWKSPYNAVDLFLYQSTQLQSYCSFRLKKAIRELNTANTYEATYTYDKNGKPDQIVEVSLVMPKCKHDWEKVYVNSHTLDWFAKCSKCGKESITGRTGKAK
jgi:hypothetical protein